jgi:hypothetical protein
MRTALEKHLRQRAHDTGVLHDRLRKDVAHQRRVDVASTGREFRAIEGAVYDERRVQDAVLALMHLNAHADTYGLRAWKSFPWEATDGLHERGLIDDPRSKAKSVALTDEGARLAEQLFTDLFGVEDAGTG